MSVISYLAYHNADICKWGHPEKKTLRVRKESCITEPPSSEPVTSRSRGLSRINPGAARGWRGVAWGRPGV